MTFLDLEFTCWEMLADLFFSIVTAFVFVLMDSVVL